MAKSFRDKSEGPVIFATPDKTLSSIFMVPTNDSWTASGLFGDVHYFVCSDKERFLKLDKGGAIYTLPSAAFETDETKGLGTKEWTSKIPVKPINKVEFESGLDAMLSLGVQIFFISKEKFKELRNSKDHGNELLINSTSENQKQNINIRYIPKVDF